MNTKFAKELKKARLAKGWSQEKAAEMCDVSRRSWQYYESGEVIPNFYVQTGLKLRLGFYPGLPVNRA